MTALWLVVVPVVVALVIAAAGRRPVGFTRWLALIGPALATFAGIQALLSAEPAGHGGAAAEATSVAADWLSAASGSIEIGLAIDPLAAVMLAVVGVVAGMVVIFSVGYMAEDRSQARYFALLSAFTAAMSMLVLSTSLVGLFVAWELVGACSYLLIGFWFTKPSAARAAIKAFLVTRIGDVGLLLALALLWRETGALSISGVLEAAPALAPATVTTVALLLFVGAAGKSAQFPLHIWLPDAMEGPTPVSALIHAATMVAAGVFLLARMAPLFDLSETARLVVLVIGTVTALGAATVAVTQTDIKRVLAYSTISQLGFMFAALGTGAWVAAMFHLVTHAAFKSLLFLASGSVIHGSGTQDLREMGGLGKAMPVTTVTWAIGVAALAGLPPLAGFFSKDAVIDAVWMHAPVAGVALFVASALTALYAARATRLAFTGEFRGTGHPHESPVVMTAPLVVLATAAVTLGAASWWFADLFGGHAGLALPVAVASTVIAVVAALAGWRLFGAGPAADERLADALGGLWRAARSAYGIDTLAMRAAAGIERASATIAERFDRRIVDGAVNGVAWLARRIGREFNELQSGEGQLYAALVGAGAVLLVSLALWLGR
ncbi:MAG: NADH-quinone oxidoreductase subunit L [Coriobacteriia bacterium]|nr:NADH-quinone oxidoreductase subunit L [Coriobacteriia bacterium]MBN2847611.1 NADH-quinone oxidoreductase subunit L [Coriobacteriia bacterium]